jgi:putative transposase
MINAMASVDCLHIRLEMLVGVFYDANVLTERKFRLYPTGAQAGILARWIRCQRVVRNAKIEETHLNSWLRLFSKFSARPGDSGEKSFDQGYSHLATETNPWLREVPSQILRNGVYRAKAAFVRYWKGEAGRPVPRGKHSGESVLLTGELFTITDGKLTIGTQKYPVGQVRWKAHRDFSAPKMLTITRCGDGAWRAAFTCEDDVILPPAEDLLIKHSFADETSVLAFDRGVANPLVDSDGQFYGLEKKRTTRLARLQSRKVRLQQKLARQRKGSANRRKTKKRLARISRRTGDLLADWRHQTTARIAASPHRVIALEDLRLANMTRTVKAKPNPAASAQGQPDFLPNGGYAKTGLNRVMLQVGLGNLSTLIQYKIRRAGQAFLAVPSHHSSQECSQCTHTSPDNRPTQAEFHCQACGHQAHADYNAAVVLRKRAHSSIQQHRPAGTVGRKTPASVRSTSPANRKPPPQRSCAGGG